MTIVTANFVPTSRKTLGAMVPYPLVPNPPSLDARKEFVAKASRWTSKAKKALRAANPLPPPWQSKKDRSMISKNGKPNRTHLANGSNLALKTDPWVAFTEPKCPDPSFDEMSHIARVNEVQKLLEQDRLEFNAYENARSACPLQFQLIQSASELKQTELEACLALVEYTSGHDYKASSIGWKPKRKQEEMQDKEMVYMLVRGRNTKARPMKRLEDGPQDVKKHHESSETPQDDGNQLNTLERMVCDYTSDDDDDAGTGGSSSVEHPGPISIVDDGNILGFMSFMFTHDDPPYEDREVVYMYEIHLKDQLRGRGLGSKLMELLEMAAKQNGVSKIMLTVFASNSGARRLYEKLGYEKDACSPEDRVVRKRVIKADYIIMSKELD